MTTPAHPEPEPVPTPEPGPPQPIPPPEPVPAPEPPHEESAPAPSGAVSIGAGPDSTDTDFIDAGPDETDIDFPPRGAFPDERDTPTEQIDAPTELISEPATQPIGEPPTELIQHKPDTSDQTQAVPARWHQPPPSEPFHAKHEKPGEWRYHPPDHLAHQHSPPAEVPDTTTFMPTVPHQPWEVPLTPDDADRRRRSGLWISVALTTTLLLCGGGAASAYLLLRDSDSGGAPDPATAVDEFMTAVYTRQDANAAAGLVCREALDKTKLAGRVEQIKGYSAEYDAPSFRWGEPAVDSQSEDRATVTVQLTMATEDEKTAQQQLTFTTIRKSGWLVCEISG